MRTGLVMEGGGFRGLYTAGVTDVMMENDIWVDGAIGVSAGATFGCNYKSRQVGRAIRYNERFCKDARYCSVRSLVFTGDLFGARFCYEELPDELDIWDAETFEKNPCAFWCVAMDINAGQPVYHQLSDGGKQDIQWIRASASMPLASRPVCLEGRELLDGGTVDSIPLAAFEGMGYERNIVIRTQAEGYRKKPNSLMPLIRASLRKYPALVEAMARRHEMYNAQLDYVADAEAAGRAFVLRPSSPPAVGRIEHDPEKLEELYRIGRQDALSQLDGMRAFLAAAGE